MLPEGVIQSTHENPAAHDKLEHISTSPVCNTAVLPFPLKETTRAASRKQL